MDFQTYPGNQSIQYFPPMISCAFPNGTEHKFHITVVEEVSTAFRCCETCGKTSRLRYAISDTYEDIKEPATEVKPE
jgi:hypothetical protein